MSKSNVRVKKKNDTTYDRKGGFFFGGVGLYETQEVDVGMTRPVISVATRYCHQGGQTGGLVWERVVLLNPSLSLRILRSG